MVAWSELKMIPNEYNDEVKAIDESLIRLLTERKALSNGRRLIPSRELVQEWSTKFGLDIPQINWLLNSLNSSNIPVMLNESGELLNVLPIMKKSIVDGFEYSLTHSMQHENSSIVFVEIKQLQNDVNTGYIRPQLLLDISGSQQYNVHRNGSHGGGGRTQITFLINPRLPENINELRFALIPYASPMESPPKEVILDQDVQFD